MFSADDTVSFVIPAQSGGYVIGLGRKLALMDWASGQITKVFDEVEKGMQTRFNDAKCDPSGRLWAGQLPHMHKIFEVYCFMWSQ